MKQDAVIAEWGEGHVLLSDVSDCLFHFSESFLSHLWWVVTWLLSPHRFQLKASESDHISKSWVLVTTSIQHCQDWHDVGVSFLPTVLQEELCNACAPLTACRKGLKPVVPSAVLRMSRRLKKSLFRRQLRRSPILDGASAPLFFIFSLFRSRVCIVRIARMSGTRASQVAKTIIEQPSKVLSRNWQISRKYYSCWGKTRQG